MHLHATPAHRRSPFGLAIQLHLKKLWGAKKAQHMHLAAVDSIFRDGVWAVQQQSLTRGEFFHNEGPCVVLPAYQLRFSDGEDAAAVCGKTLDGVKLQKLVGWVMPAKQQKL
jgi:hypothetical protein